MAGKYSVIFTQRIIKTLKQNSIFFCSLNKIQKNIKHGGIVMKKALLLSLIISSFLIFFCCTNNPVSPSEKEWEWELLDSNSQYVVIEEIPAIFYGGEKNYRSSDGNTWEQTSLREIKIMAYSEKMLFVVGYVENLWMFASSKDNGQTWEEIKQKIDGYSLSPSCLCKNKHPLYYQYPLIGYFYFYQGIYRGVYGACYPTFKWKKLNIPSVEGTKKIISRKEGIYSMSFDSLVVYSWDEYWKEWEIIYADEGYFTGIGEDTVNNQIWVEKAYYQLMKTSNGKTWDKIEVDENAKKAMSGSAYFAFYKNHIFVGHSGLLIEHGLIFSQDGGKTWKKDEIIPGGVNGIGIFRGYLYVSTKSGLFRKKL